jgi:uncharacterized protein
MPSTWRTLALGLAAGVLSGLFGIGGGAVMVPGLVLWLREEQHHAHATSLAAILVIAPVALAVFAQDGQVAFGPAAILTIAAIAGAWLGAGVMHRISATRLARVFGVLLLLVALRLLLPAPADPAAAAHPLDVARVAALLALGAGTGALSAVMGVGGGVVLVPVLVLLFEFSQHVAEGTSLLVVLPSALVGALRHADRGYTRWRLGWLLGAGGVLGAFAGAQIALTLSSIWLQRLFALLLAVTGARMLRPG